KDGEHRPDSLYAARLARRRERLTEAALQPLAQALEPLVQLGAEERERREGGGDRKRVSAQRSRLVHGAERRNLLHDVAASTVDGQGHPSADDLPQAGQVWGESVQSLGTGGGQAAAGHDLVEDAERAVLPAQVDDRLQEARLWR